MIDPATFPEAAQRAVDDAVVRNRESGYEYPFSCEMCGSVSALKSGIPPVDDRPNFHSEILGFVGVCDECKARRLNRKRNGK